MEIRQRENGKGENKKQTGRKRQNENASAQGGLKVVIFTSNMVNPASNLSLKCHCQYLIKHAGLESTGNHCQT